MGGEVATPWSQQHFTSQIYKILYEFLRSSVEVKREKKI